MQFTRRHLLTSLLATAALPREALALPGEPFPVFASDAQQVPYRFRRREVDYSGSEAAGTIVVDTRHKFLFLVLGRGRAIRYGVGVGRAGYAWSGVAIVGRKAKWPRWTPTPDQMAHSKIAASYAAGLDGGMTNPLGARALYLYQNGRDTFYRIHGTPDPTSIGYSFSSGCIRMLNMDVADLYERVGVGTRVVVLGSGG
ncbi:MAG: L,D-transpeptidase [Rhizobiales bacterium]|nr:L,D-transpeptidase [Hyphomicrobiales bacterium]